MRVRNWDEGDLTAAEWAALERADAREHERLCELEHRFRDDAEEYRAAACADTHSSDVVPGRLSWER